MKRFLKNTDGATAIEYGLILALIVIAVIGALGTLGSAVKSDYEKTANSFPK